MTMQYPAERCFTVSPHSCETVKQNHVACNTARNASETESLKALAWLALERNSRRNDDETNREIAVSSRILKTHSMKHESDPEIWEERAAVIEHDAGVPKKWAEAFARVCVMQRPKAMTREEWTRFIDNLGTMLDDRTHLQDLARFGWGLADVFGCHPAAPARRVEMAGLLMLMREGEVIAIVDEHQIALRSRTGSLLIYRRPVCVAAGGVMIWQLERTDATNA